MNGVEQREVGRVWIVGAGPGDPELLTLKARRLLDEAEVIFYDALVSVGTLRSVGAARVFVGKRKGFRSFAQEEINRMLLEAAVAGKRVVRLKGGDPFIFGRGGEEVLYLRDHGVACEVVPGVSALLGAAASLQVPLTHRGVAASLALCAGVPSIGARTVVGEDQGPGFALPSADTLAVYMAAAALREIAGELLARGWLPGTPAALIHNATLPDERVWHSSLDKLAAGEIAGVEGELPTPLLLLIGEVVRLGRVHTREPERILSGRIKR